MNRKPISSTNIKSVGYDPNKRTLQIEFKRGTVYDYEDVPQTMFDKFMASKSKGKFFISDIRDAFKWRRLDPETPPHFHV